MALFHGERDAAVMLKMMSELVIDWMDTEIALYKPSVRDMDVNIYEESDMVYHQPIKIPCVIARQEQTYQGSELGQDYTQITDFAFIRDYLRLIDTYIEVGDLIEYNGEYWEIDAIIENQYYGGKNPDYSFAGPRWGFNISIVANTHLTRRSKIQLEDIRSSQRLDENDLPDNI